METNESIVGREIVVFDECKRVGKVVSATVDYKARNISHLVVKNATAGSQQKLPFPHIVSIGDTYVTVESKRDFMPLSYTQEHNGAQEFDLVNLRVFSRKGNKLGQVERFEFDSETGLVTRIILAEGKTYVAESFLFFAPEFAFVDESIDDGTTPSTSSDEEEADEADDEDDDSDAAPDDGGGGPERADEATDDDEDASEDAEADEDASEDAEADEDASEDAEAERAPVLHRELSNAGRPVDAAALRSFLVGETLSSDVKSADGLFDAEAGTVLTEDMVLQAERHNAVLLLTAAVES